MADLPGAVTDTHALLFHAAGTGKLGPRAAKHYDAAERQQALVYVPAGVCWEVSLLARGGRISLRRSVQAFFEDLFSNPAFQPHHLTFDQLYLADDLRFNRDPFDALIVAAAQSLDLPLLTRDPDIRASGAVRVVW
ncbi:MAG: type II toxin-antitoxin system VapC family toxin [Acidobacteria bacterium]|nr:type II toxin-antitoxin system VapC family toxin [Acidobacteriota bacterium]